MVMALKLNHCHSGKHHQHLDQSKCTKVEAKIMLTSVTADVAQSKTGNPHFYLVGVRCLKQFGVIPGSQVNGKFVIATYEHTLLNLCSQTPNSTGIPMPVTP
jgi:hypothetical protein